MKSVVYILGAGFSAEFGPPVVSRFFLRAREIASQDGPVADRVRGVLSKLREYNRGLDAVSFNPWNIEEILSILEAQISFGAVNREEMGEVQQFIADVINQSTTRFERFARLDHREVGSAFQQEHRALLQFLLSMKPILIGKEELHLDSSKLDFHSYSVISLNYDQLVEDAWKSYDSGSSVGFDVHKLHGCVSTPSSIVPPTWRKTVVEGALDSKWREAFRQVSSATDIRFVGYSLPISDQYFRCFLQAALQTNRTLQSIKALCLDPDGEVEARYRSIFPPELLEFRSIRTGTFLRAFDQGDILKSSGNKDYKRVSAEFHEFCFESGMKRKG